MSAGEELVDVVDADGIVVGVAPRREVRARNLRHRATGVVVRDPHGRIYVHRRTDTKDVYPGLYDCCAGGVVGAGEDVNEAARRELAEELGVIGVPLRPLFTASYADDQTRYLAHLYEVVWDGPVTWQTEEVAWGDWLTVDELRELLADPLRPFVPDSRALVSTHLLGDDSA